MIKQNSFKINQGGLFTPLALFQDFAFEYHALFKITVTFFLNHSDIFKDQHNFWISLFLIFFDFAESYFNLFTLYQKLTPHFLSKPLTKNQDKYFARTFKFSRSTPLRFFMSAFLSYFHSSTFVPKTKIKIKTNLTPLHSHSLLLNYSLTNNI